LASVVIKPCSIRFQYGFAPSMTHQPVDGFARGSNPVRYLLLRLVATRRESPGNLDRKCHSSFSGTPAKFSSLPRRTQEHTASSLREEEIKVNVLISSGTWRLRLVTYSGSELRKKYKSIAVATTAEVDCTMLESREQWSHSLRFK